MDLECSANIGKNTERLKLKVIYNLKQLRNYKNEYENIRKRFAKQQDSYIDRKSNDAIVGDTLDVSRDKQLNKKLIEHEEFAWEQNEKLENAKRTTYEMENVSMDIMKNLEHGTNQMKTIDRKLVDMNHNLDDSNSVIGRMLKRENRNKIVIVMLILAFIITFAIILFFKLK